MRIVALSRFDEDGPAWPDGAWSIVLFFEQPPVEQVGRDAMEAKVAFAFQEAPQERMHPGARFGVYYGGRKKIADVEVLD